MADDTIREIWKPIAGNADYEVSSLGRVRRATDLLWAARPGVNIIRKRAGHFLSLKPNRRGYVMVTLPWPGYSRCRSVQVHRLVAQAFIPNPDNKPEVNHKNLGPADNRVDNLEWSTRRENAQHAYAAGRWTVPSPPFGTAHRSAKLTDDDVRYIRKLLRSGISHNAIGRHFKVHGTVIMKIARGEIWKHVI